MRRLRTALTWTAASLGVGLPLAACANILGIDDGIPRAEDASVSDVHAEGAVLDAGLDADSQAEAASPYSPLSCGSATCNAVTEGCCSRKSAVDGSVVYAYSCIADDGGSCDGGQLITCDRPDNCDKQGHVGEVCCALGTTPPSTVACTSALDCDYPETGLAYRLCEPGDDELCQPDSGKSCSPSASAAVGYLLCK